MIFTMLLTKFLQRISPWGYIQWQGLNFEAKIKN